MTTAYYGQQLYVTPPNLITKLLAGIKIHSVGSVLEPSAGTGAIAIAMRTMKENSFDRWEGDKPLDIDCVEIDPALQSILRGEGLRVVHDDFLTFNTFKRYNLIIANVPFADGDQHLHRMLDIQRLGGKIRCLLNAETLRNPFSNSRKDLVRRLDEYGAEIEYIPNAFNDADRRAQVDVALVRVDLPCSDEESVILDDMRKAAEQKSAAYESSSLVHGDVIQGFVDQYNFEAKAGIALMNEYSRLVPHMLNKIGDERAHPILNLQIGSYSQTKDATVNNYVRELRTKYWTALFADPRFTGILTSDLRDKFLAEVAALVDYEFSAFNILTIRQRFGGLALAGIDQAILDLFEELSVQHAYDGNEMEKNIWYFSGWKTNKAWCINKKVIQRWYALRKDKWDTKVSLSWNSDAIKKLTDIEKVFQYLDAQPTDTSDIPWIVESAVNRGQTSCIETEYFEVTFYLKGTTHIKFKRLDLLKKFNLYGANGRKWLPPSYGQSAYADMSHEEQAVVDSFEGEAEYAKTLARRDFFLTKPGVKLLELAP